jgi:hypothetical protein
MTISSIITANLLGALIEDGAFASRAKTTLDIWRSGRDYIEIKEAKGVAKAEKWLEIQDQETCHSAFASSVEPVAHGILALAKAKSNSVENITAYTAVGYSLFDTQYGPRHKFVVFNPATTNSQLQAVVLETGYQREGRVAEVGLVMLAERQESNPLVIAKVDTTGYRVAYMYEPYIRTVEGRKPFTDTDAFLRHLLGMAPLKDVHAPPTIGDLAIIGIPDAEHYFVKEVSKLGDHFTEHAKRLGPDAH